MTKITKILIELELKQDLRDACMAAQEAKERSPGKKAQAKCMEIARQFIPYILKEDDLHYAAVGNDDGGISLVLHSFEKKRRLTFDISANGTEVQELRTDKALIVHRLSHLNNRLPNVVESVRWLMTGE